MKKRFGLLLLAILIFSYSFIGCSESRSDYKSGIYWLEKENNWQMAARSFGRALEKDPGNWKISLKLIEALSGGEEAPKFRKQLSLTIAAFPDKARHPDLAKFGIIALGEKEFNKLVSPAELNYLGGLHAQKPKDIPIIAKCIMAACRSFDSLAVRDYFNKAMTLTNGEKLADSLLQEMRFFIGPSQVDWLTLEWRIKAHPEDFEARLQQVNSGIISGDSILIITKIKEIARNTPEVISDEGLVKRIGRLAGYNSFNSKKIARGWDASYSPDYRKIVFLKNMGIQEDPDYYIYERNLSSGKETPILKAGQQTLGFLAWPTYSNDGKWIYFFASKDKHWYPGAVGRFNLYRVKPRYNTKPERLTNADLLICEPFEESDGSILLVRKDVGSTRASVEIIRVAKDGNLESVSRIGEPTISACFTPEGDSLLFMTDRGLFRRSINGGNISVDLPWIGLRFLQLSPDGKILKFVNRSNQTVFIDRNNPLPIYWGKTTSSWVSFGKDGAILTSSSADGWTIVLESNFNNKISDISGFLNKLQ